MITLRKGQHIPRTQNMTGLLRFLPVDPEMPILNFCDSLRA